MQINRLFEIIYLLIERGRMTAGELAEHFEVSKRTILRDIDALSAAGIPLYTIQGKGGGIAIVDGFVLNKAVLTEAEQNQILYALQGLAVTQNTDDKQVLGKLQSLFQKPNTAWIEVDFSRWGTTLYDKDKFEILKTSILGKRAIAFRYLSSYSEETERTVYPLKLVFKSRAWYMQGYCLKRQDYRTFKVNRMLEVAATDEVFGDGYFPPPIESRAPAPSAIVISLEFKPDAAYRVYDDFDEGCVERNEAGYLYVSAAMPEDEMLYRYLESFGDDVKVLSPKHINESLNKR